MEKAFIEMDSDEDGCVTEAEFVKACLNNRFAPMLHYELVLFCSFCFGGEGVGYLWLLLV